MSTHAPSAGSGDAGVALTHFCAVLEGRAAAERMRKTTWRPSTTLVAAWFSAKTKGVVYPASAGKGPVGKGFKNVLCQATPPQDGGWTNPEARRGCIRRRSHSGFCRNRFWEWREGQDEWAWLRPDKVEVPDDVSWAGGFRGGWRRGYSAGRWDRLRGAKRGSARNPYLDWRTDRGSITYSRTWTKAWRDGYDAGWNS